MGNLQNFIFQWYWELFKKGRVKRTTMVDYGKDPEKGAEQIAKEALSKVRVAMKFGKVVAVFVGDSNCEFGGSADQMVKFKCGGIVVNIGKAASHFGHWNRILKTEPGRMLLDLCRIERISLILNCGGNHVLQGDMVNFESAAKEFRSHTSFMQTITADLPDIMTPLLSIEYGVPEKTIRANVRKGNTLLKKIFPNYMPLGEILMNIDDEWNNAGLLFELKEDVIGDKHIHYSNKFNKKVRFPYYSDVFNKVIT